ncbi:MAG: YbaN family protein [Alphaproteobacteria bacterium]
MPPERRLPDDNCPVPEAGPLMRPVLIAFGWLCVMLGAIGVVVPGMPTTVFLIAAAWAFARSSRRFHDWLYGHKVFGAALENWRRHRVIPVRAKILAISMMSLSLVIVVAAGIGESMLLAGMLSVMLPASLYIVTRRSAIPQEYVPAKND